MRPKRVVHVPPGPGCFLVQWNGSAQRDVRGVKEGQAGGRYRIIEADSGALPYHGQWSGIGVDDDERTIVWSESDMTAAFYSFCSSPLGILSKQLTSLFRDSWPRHLTLLMQKNLQCIQLCASCVWAGRAHAGCSKIFIDGCACCHRSWEQGLTQQRDYRERWTKADRISSLFTWSAKRNWCTSPS